MRYCDVYPSVPFGYPLVIFMAALQRVTAATFQSTASLLGVLPRTILFILFQRTLAKGIIAGSVK